MSSDYEIIDESKWKRAQHCAIFRNYVEPCFCITTELDITCFHKMVKEKGYPVTFALIYEVTRCANEIEEFRYRFLDGQIVLYKQIHTAFTSMDPETELFKVVTVPMQDTMEEYIKLARKTEQEQKAYFTGPLGNDVYQFSPIPWLNYTHISHTNSGKKDSATPLIDWGRFFERDGKLIMPFSVQVHHSFVDGFHVSKFVEQLQKRLMEI